MKSLYGFLIKDYTWRFFLALPLLPQVFIALSYGIYVIGGNWYYVSFGCLAVSLLLVALSVAGWLFKLVHLFTLKRWIAFASGLILYLVAASAPYTLLKLAVRSQIQ